MYSDSSGNRSQAWQVDKSKSFKLSVFVRAYSFALPETWKGKAHWQKGDGGGGRGGGGGSGRGVG